ncbi:MAG: hypothetical protein J2P26_08150 [Nocardiopsaceae bacterium]|nr:hypothetical protein [Nocardiopsaceae bacterium]
MRVRETKLWARDPDDAGGITRKFLIADVFTHRPRSSSEGALSSSPAGSTV